MKRAMVFALLVFLVMPLRGYAEEYYAGVTFIQAQGMKGCLIARFKASDGSYTLEQADTLYVTLFGALDALDIDNAQIETDLPSQVQANGYSGEALLEAFLSKGTGVCTFGGEPSDAVAFVSTFRCQYQNENQMCFRLYLDAGTNDLSMIGIPSGIATLGGMFVKREVWDVMMGLIMANSDAFLLSSPAERTQMLNLLVPTVELPLPEPTD